MKKCPFTYTFYYIALSRESLPSFLTDSKFVNFPTHEKLFITHKSIISVHLWSFEDILRDKKLESPSVHVLSWSGMRWCCAFLLQLSYCKQSSFLLYLVLFFAFLWFFFFFFLVILLFMKASRHSAEVLTSDKTIMCLIEEIHVLEFPFHWMFLAPLCMYLIWFNQKPEKNPYNFILVLEIYMKVDFIHLFTTSEVNAISSIWQKKIRIWTDIHPTSCKNYFPFINLNDYASLSLPTASQDFKCLMCVSL